MKKLTLVYFTTVSKNTEFFVDKLGFDHIQIPEKDHLKINNPFVLIFPTYGGGKLKGAVPKPVVDFLKDPENRKYLIGIIGSGDRNYGEDFCLGAKVLSEKLKVPLLYQYEIRGTNTDINKVKDGLKKIENDIN